MATPMEVSLSPSLPTKPRTSPGRAPSVHADTNLVRALADRIGHYAVDAHGSKQDCNARKDSEQLHIEAVNRRGMLTKTSSKVMMLVTG